MYIEEGLDTIDDIGVRDNGAVVGESTARDEGGAIRFGDIVRPDGFEEASGRGCSRAVVADFEEVRGDFVRSFSDGIVFLSSFGVAGEEEGATFVGDAEDEGGVVGIIFRGRFIACDVFGFDLWTEEVDWHDGLRGEFIFGGHIDIVRSDHIFHLRDPESVGGREFAGATKVDRVDIIFQEIAAVTEDGGEAAEVICVGMSEEDGVEGASGGEAVELEVIDDDGASGSFTEGAAVACVYEDILSGRRLDPESVALTDVDDVDAEGIFWWIELVVGADLRGIDIDGGSGFGGNFSAVAIFLQTMFTIVQAVVEFGQFAIFVEFSVVFHDAFTIVFGACDGDVTGVAVNAVAAVDGNDFDADCTVWERFAGSIIWAGMTGEEFGEMIGAVE